MESIAVLAGIVLAAVFAVAWMFLPFMISRKMDRMIKLLEQSNELSASSNEHLGPAQQETAEPQQ